MEDPSDASATKTCYLGQLPQEIQHLIREFIEHESDDESIERVKGRRKGEGGSPLEGKKIMVAEGIDFPYGASKLTHTIQIHNKATQKTKELYSYEPCPPHFSDALFSFSPHGSKILIVDRNSIRNEACVELLRIHDMKNDTYREKTYPRDATGLCVGAALSDFGQYALGADIARIIRKKGCQHFLCLTDSAGVGHKEIPLSLNNPIFCDFNKQGTKVFVTDLNDDFEIISLKDHYDTAPTNIPKKNLIDYFRERGVCKNWPSNR
jgi:hypothetical protein